MAEPSASPVSVIVVDDEADLREEVVDYLTDRGIAARGADGGAALDRLMREAPVDLVVLDLGLPTEDGIAIANRLRARGEVFGIIMMTARARVEERVLGYETGADVYLVKPVDYDELLATIHATLRNQPKLATTVTRPAFDPAIPAHELPDSELPDSEPRDSEPRDSEPRHLDPWHLDLATWRLAAPSGAVVRLSRAEAQTLSCLAEKPGQAVSRDDIAMRMGKRPNLGEHRYVDQIISRLRRKITTELGWEAPIGSAHGQGYYFSSPVSLNQS